MLLSGQWHTLSSIKQTSHIDCVLGSSSAHQDSQRYSKTQSCSEIDQQPLRKAALPENAPQLLEHHRVVMGADSEFAQVDLVAHRVESDFVAPDVTGGGVPGDAEAGPGGL